MATTKIFFRLIFLCAALALGSGGSWAAGTVNVQRGAALQKQGVLLLDVRTPEEFAQGHAPGAKLIPLNQLPQRLGELQAFKNQPIALICQSGRRSTVAQNFLEQAGFSQTVNVEGGMLAWVKAGLPVQTGAAQH